MHLRGDVLNPRRLISALAKEANSPGQIRVAEDLRGHQANTFKKVGWRGRFSHRSGVGGGGVISYDGHNPATSHESGGQPFDSETQSIQTAETYLSINDASPTQVSSFGVMAESISRRPTVHGGAYTSSLACRQAASRIPI